MRQFKYKITDPWLYDCPVIKEETSEFGVQEIKNKWLYINDKFERRWRKLLSLLSELKMNAVEL